MKKIVATTSLPVDRLTATDCNADARAKKKNNGGNSFDQSEASKSKMAARGPQNGRRGLERGPTLGYWALPSTFAK